MQPYEFDYIFHIPGSGEIWGPYSTVYFIVFTLGTIVANFFFFYGKYRFKSNLLTYTLVNRASRNAAIAFSLGFVFFLCRLVQLQPFAARLFLDVAAVLLIYFIVRGIAYMFRTYPKAKAEWAAQRERILRKSEPRAAVRPAAPAPAKPVATGAIASGSADGGESSVSSSEETKVIRPAGLSERGLKRRERKRNKR